MRLLILSMLVMKIATGAPPNLIDYPKDNAQIIRYENNDLGKGSYSFAFEQSDGTKHEQQGELKNEGLEDEYIVMRGVFSWVGPDGVTYTVTYVADQNGFVPIIEQGQGGSVPNPVASLRG